MTIIAKFSNGFEDKYNGTRDVKAAWAIIRKADGKIINSGHSLDRVKAAKTAAGNLSHSVSDYGPIFGRTVYPGIFKTLTRYGYEGRNTPSMMKTWMRQSDEKRRAAIEADHIIEVIDL